MQFSTKNKCWEISPFLSNVKSIEFVDCKKSFHRIETKKYTRFDELEYNVTRHENFIHYSSSKNCQAENVIYIQIEGFKGFVFPINLIKFST